MPKQAEELKAMAVANLKTEGLHFVGGVTGLALQVLPSGARTWVLRMTVGGRRRDMGLGGYPSVTLAQARDLARQARAKVKEGVDPIEEGRAARSELKAAQATALTFDQCAEKFIASKKSGGKNAKHKQQWKNSLKMYASPVMGSLLIRDVGLTHVLAVLEPIWEKKTETASRVRSRIEQVLDWATVRKCRTGENPARWRGHLDKVLAKPTEIAKVKHHAALPVGEVAAFTASLKQQEGMGAKALRFAILTAARSGEVRNAVWSEFDITSKVWTIPAERMKANREHRVPLSEDALALLRALPRVAGTDLVFPSSRGKALSDMTLTSVIRRMHVDAVPHGFRSTFRDWVSERTSYPREVAEMALAHKIANQVEAAYRRGDLFEKRIKMMKEWAAFLSRPEQPAGVVEIHKKRA